MIGRIGDFGRLLRTEGVRVSAAEVLDALAALDAVGIETREVFRGALRSCLVKREEDFPTFDRCFDTFFRGPLSSRPRRQERRGGEGESARGREGSESSRSGARRDEREGSSERKGDERRMGRRSPRAQEAGERTSEGTAAGSMKFGGLDLRQWRPSDDSPARLWQREPGPDPGAIYEAIDRLAQRLVSRESLRARRARRGRLDVRATISRSRRTAGVPVDLVMRRRKITKPKLVVLCDVSGSVWRVSRFLLRLVHGLVSRYARVRSFVFVDRAVEVTQLLSRLPFEAALVEIERKRDLNLYGFSDFGRVFYFFWREHLGLVAKDTIVVILGDARTNLFEPMPWCLEEIARRAHRVIWLNPEERARWNQDDSVIAGYAPACDAVLECWTLAHLRQAAEVFLHAGWGRR